jgi:AcrR family transcriptional regulator
MGTAERRERERGALRERIVEATREILSEEGLGALSIRAIAERIEYAPATIYTHFRDKDDLVRAVVAGGVGVLGRYLREGLASVREGASGHELQRAVAHAYARFAVENTASFRVMFELPGVPRLDAEPPDQSGLSLAEERPFALGVAVLKRAVAEGDYRMLGSAEEGALIGWSMVHGLVSLYLSGHFGGNVADRAQLERLLDAALDTLYEGWRRRGEGA